MDTDPLEVRQLIDQLNSYDKEKRRTAVIKLGLVGGKEVVLALIMAVKNEHQDPIVRGRAALMLGRLGDPLAVVPLIEALWAPGFQTPFFAAQSLGLLGDHRAIQPLRTLIEEANGRRDKVYQAAELALKQLVIQVEEVQ